MEWLAKGIMVAVKRNGTDCVDAAAIDNERRLYELLLLNPHDHILPVYGICTDAPDGKVRLVMKFCERGSLDVLLRDHAQRLVGGVAVPAALLSIKWDAEPPARARGLFGRLPCHS
jgi:hypothetical protein